MSDDPRNDDRRKAVQRSRHGTRVSVDELVAKSNSVFDRVVPILERAATRIRSRLSRK